MGHLKLIIKPFDSGWNFIQYIIDMLISLIVIWTWKFGSMARSNIISLQTSVNQVCNTAWDLLPKWISKPRLRLHKNHDKTSHGAGKFSQNFCESKRSWYNEHLQIRKAQPTTYFHALYITK